MQPDEIVQTLKKSLNQKEGSVILLKGQWGVGKTYFWDKFHSDFASGLECAYVSLFGKKCIEDIKNDALVQIFSRNKYVDKFQGIAKKLKGSLKIDENASFGLSGHLLSSVASLFKVGELSECVVCIDDFERKSSELKIEEVLGFVSILSERYGCKFVLLVNEEDFKGSDEESIYVKYKEKVFDFEMVFENNIQNILESFSDSLKLEQKVGIARAVELSRENSVRMLQKAIRDVKRFEEQCSTLFGKDESNYLAFKVSMLSFLYNYAGHDSLQFISADDFNDINTPMRQTYLTYEDCHVKFSSHVSYYDILDKELWNMFTFRYVDFDAVQVQVRQKVSDKFLESIMKDATDIMSQLLFDVSVDPRATVNGLFSLVEVNAESMLNACGLQTTLYCFDALQTLHNNLNSVKVLKEQVFSSYALGEIKKTDCLEKYGRINENPIIQYIYEHCPELSKKLDTEMYKLFESISGIDQVKKELQNVLRHSAWSEEVEKLLNTLPVSVISDYIRSDPEFCELSVRFLSQRPSDSTTFDRFRDMFIKSFRSIGELPFRRYRWDTLKKELRIDSDS